MRQGPENRRDQKGPVGTRNSQGWHYRWSGTAAARWGFKVGAPSGVGDAAHSRCRVLPIELRDSMITLVITWQRLNQVPLSRCPEITPEPRSWQSESVWVLHISDSRTIWVRNRCMIFNHPNKILSSGMSWNMSSFDGLTWVRHRCWCWLTSCCHSQSCRDSSRDPGPDS